MIKKSNHSVVVWKRFTPCDWWNLFSSLFYGLTFSSELTDFICMRNRKIIWCWKWSCRLEIEWFHARYNFGVYFYNFTCVSQLNQICFTDCGRRSHPKNEELLIKKLEISKIWWWRLISFTKQECKLICLLWSYVFVYLKATLTKNTPYNKMSRGTWLTFVIKILSEFL